MDREVLGIEYKQMLPIKECDKIYMKVKDEWEECNGKNGNWTPICYVLYVAYYDDKSQETDIGVHCKTCDGQSDFLTADEYIVKRG